MCRSPTGFTDNREYAAAFDRHELLCSMLQIRYTPDRRAALGEFVADGAPAALTRRDQRSGATRDSRRL